MITAISSGVEVTVETVFQPEQSARLGAFVYAYQITITNHNLFSVQLLRRSWDINHGNGHHMNVSGEGVVGQTPLLLSGQAYQYISGTQLESPIGRMSGFYYFERKDTGEELEVVIPAFDLLAPVILN